MYFYINYLKESNNGKLKSKIKIILKYACTVYRKTRITRFNKLKNNNLNIIIGIFKYFNKKV